MQRLTEAFVRSVKKPGKYGDQHGLILRVSASGGKQWIWRGRVDGRPRDLGLGGYPYVTLKEARAIAFEYRTIARHGGNPAVTRSKVPTFRRAAERVIELHAAKWKPGGKSEAQWRSSLESYVFPHIGANAIDKVTSADVMACLTPIWHSRPTTARRVLQRISAIMRWSIAQGFREDNPADDRITAALGTNARPPKHLPAMPHTKVPAAVDTIRKSGTYPTVRLAAEFVVLTATRPGETRGARWCEIEMGDRLWKIPAERMKANRPHRVPLSARAVEVLSEAAAFKDASGLVFPDRKGQEIPSWVFPKMFKRLKMVGTLHGMRTAFRIWCAEKGTSREVAETCLAHRIGTSAEQAYRRTDFLEQRRELMEQWSNYLQAPGFVKHPSSRRGIGWEQAAKLDAQNSNRELLTPLAASFLFEVSVPAVHRAVSENLVCAHFRLEVTDRPVILIRLDSAVQCWGLPDSPLLEHMRDHGQVLGIGGQIHNILSSKRLVTLLRSAATVRDHGCHMCQSNSPISVSEHYSA